MAARHRQPAIIASCRGRCARSGPQNLTSSEVEAALAAQETVPGDADVGGAAQAELEFEVDFSVDRESERRIAGAWILEIEFEAEGAARHRDPTGHDRMEHTVQGCRVVIDDPVPDVAVAAQQALARYVPRGPTKSVGRGRTKA